jgi:hypothetical protein
MEGARRGPSPDADAEAISEALQRRRTALAAGTLPPARSRGIPWPLCRFSVPLLLRPPIRRGKSICFLQIGESPRVFPSSADDAGTCAPQEHNSRVVKIRRSAALIGLRLSFARIYQIHPLAVLLFCTAEFA